MSNSKARFTIPDSFVTSRRPGRHWNGVVFPKGSVQVEARVGEFERDVGLRSKGNVPPKRLDDWVMMDIIGWNDDNMRLLTTVSSEIQ